MNAFTSRAYTGAMDLHRLVEFAQHATRARLPRSTYMKAGDVVWMLYALDFDAYQNVRLWFDRAELIAYAAFEPPLLVYFDIQPGSSLFEPLADAILTWAEDRRQSLKRLGCESIPRALAMLGEETVSTTALDTDSQRISILKRHRFTRTERFQILYSRDLTGVTIKAPELETALRLRHATDSDLEARVDVHRDAWSVWGPSSATVETYRRLRSAPIYDPELDVVLEDPASSFLSYCIGWLDRANAIGHFEPVGCRPAFTGRGYARAVTIEGMRRMQPRGTHTALVSTESVNERAMALYPSCGFVEVDRAHYYVKRLNF